MPNNKDHHYVSQFYLRNFGIGDSIALYNIAKRRHVPQAPIGGQCQRPYFYGRDDTLDSKLRSIESAGSRAIRGIIDTNRLPDSATADYLALINFISFQFGRTPDAVAVMRRMQEKLGDAMTKSIAGVAGVPAQQALLDEIRRRWWAPLPESLKIAEETAPMLLDLQPTLVLNSTPTVFITSDFPAVLFNPWCRGWKASGVTGFSSSGLVVFFPLSPRHTLLLVDRDVYATTRDSSGLISVGPRDAIALNCVRLIGIDKNLYYQRDERTKTLIDNLPFHWCRPRIDLVRVNTAKSEQDGSFLVVFFQQQLDVKLDLSFLRVRDRARRVPLRERARTWRAAAVSTARSLGLDARDDEDRAPRIPGQSWRVVERT